MTVEFPHKLEDRVTIKANATVGTVVGLHLDREEIRWYLVQYVDTAKVIHEDWFRDVELA